MLLERKQKKQVALGTVLALAMLSTVNSQSLQSIETVNLQDGSTQLRYHFDRDIQNPKNFLLSSKNMIVLDFKSTGMQNSLRNRNVNNLLIDSYSNVFNSNVLRSTINVKRDVEYFVDTKGKQVNVTIKSKNSSEVTPKNWDNSVQSNISQKIMPTSKDISFFRNSQGAGVIEISLPSDKTSVAVIQEKQRNIKLSLPNFIWQPSQVRRIEVTDFATPVSAIEVVNVNGQGQINVLTQSNFEYSSQQLGNKYQLIVKPSVKKNTAANKNAGISNIDVFTGELISINFQDIDVRSVLQIIADFTGLNIVVSDSVNSRITVRLQNVPWDQALDVVLKSKGLVKQQVGNVVFIMPAAEFKQQAPQLITEIIQLNNAKAEDMVKILATSRRANGANPNSDNSATGLSEYGSINVDAQQNVLIIRDTYDQVKTVKALVERLDRPLRQVTIGAQLVITTSNFARDVGVRWGIGGLNRNTGGNNGGWGGSESGSAGAPGYSFGSGSAGFTDYIGTDSGYSRPASGKTVWGGGAFDFGINRAPAVLGLSILKRTFNVSAELQLMQDTSQGQILSSPTLTTTDGKEAYIQQGSQIAYSTSSDNGTNTEFKDVTLELRVTPQLTPDDRIIMDLLVKKDDPSGYAPTGEPIIAKREIKTQAIVRDGETVLLGGIYEVTSSKGVSKVPFFGDLPFVGNLFKNNTNEEKKAEMVIFLTPNIIK